MKKSKVAIGVIAVLGAAWIGGAWFTGQTAETEYKRQIEQANQKFKALGVSDSLNVEFKNKSFDRGLFSSQVEDEVVISLPQAQKQLTIPFSTKLYHGPLPLNRLAQLNFLPVMYAAEGFITKNESTQALFETIKSDKPIQYYASTGYGLNTNGGFELAGGEFVDPQSANNKISWSNIVTDFDVNKDLAGTYNVRIDALGMDFANLGGNELESVKLKWQGIRFDTAFAPTKWAYLYTGKGSSSVESLEMTGLDENGKAISFVEKGVKGTSEISLDGDFISLKGTNSVDSIKIDNTDLGKVVYNLEFNHLEANAINALLESFVAIFNAAKEQGANTDALVGELQDTWVNQHGMAIFNNQPQIKLNPLSISDEQGKLSLDLNIALAKNPKFDLMRGNLYKQFTDFAVDIQLDKATAENLMVKLAPKEEQNEVKAMVKAKIEELAAEGAKNGFAVNNEKSVTMKLVLENGELKLNGRSVPEEQVQGILLMLIMGAAMQH